MRALERYLDGHARREHLVAARLPARYDAAVVVPVRDEPPELVDGLRAPCGDRRVLAVVVVNARIGDDPAVHDRNAACMRVLADRGRSLELGEGILWVEAKHPDLLVIDRSSAAHAFGARDGVGLARRIGGDVVAGLWASGRLAVPWIHYTDADAVLGRDHFELSPVEHAAVALVHPYWHQRSGDPRLDEAVALYEIGLRWYVAGLGFAGSWWAYATLGSCISVHVDAYAAVRGVPLREAAEDFYLLAKIAKLGTVIRPERSVVQLASRASDRVPFGTGPGVSRLMAMRVEGRTPAVYHPESFAHLGGTLRRIRAFAHDPEGTSGLLDEPLASAWRRLGIEPGLRGAIRSATTEAQRLQRALEWFDAFRTLKLVHALRDHALPPMPWRDALAAFAPTAAFHGERDLDAVRHALAALEPTRVGAQRFNSGS
jgi:hypothetical protein